MWSMGTKTCFAYSSLQALGSSKVFDNKQAKIMFKSLLLLLLTVRGSLEYTLKFKEWVDCIANEHFPDLFGG